MEGTLQKKISETQTKEISTKSANQYLTYDILRIIFKYLNGMELSNASMVCRSWLEAANNEKRTRGPVCFIEHHSEFLNNTMQYMEYIKTHIINKLPIKPALGLFFAPTHRSISEADCFCNLLPTNCNTVTLGTYGAIMNNWEIEENVHNIVCAFLPEIPDVTIKTFKISNQPTIKSVEKHFEEISSVFYRSKTDSKKSMCLLLLCTLEGRSLAKEIVNSFKKWDVKGEFSLWGGVASNLLECNSRDRKSNKCVEPAHCVAITLSGSFDSWTVIVDKSCKTYTRVEQQLTSFKDYISLKKHSIAFMFACCARGTNMFTESNVESSIFKKLFPNIPLVGCFGDGEFVYNPIPRGCRNKKPKWCNEMTTVFLIITYG